MGPYKVKCESTYMHGYLFILNSSFVWSGQEKYSNPWALN